MGERWTVWSEGMSASVRSGGRHAEREWLLCWRSVPGPNRSMPTAEVRDVFVLLRTLIGCKYLTAIVQRG